MASFGERKSASSLGKGYATDPIYEFAKECCSGWTTSGINARYGPWAILIQASIIQIITAAINKPDQVGKFMPVKWENPFAILPEFGNNHKAIEAIIAPPNKYGLLLPNLDFVLSDKAPISGWTTIPVKGPANQIKPYKKASAPKFSVTGPDKIILICHANCNPRKPNAKFKKFTVVNFFKPSLLVIISPP